MSDKVWNKASIVELLMQSDAAVVRALKTIYARQTATEQACLSTVEHNGRGFTGVDAQVLSDIAQRLPRYNDRMTPRQMNLVRNKIKKYWRQLLEEVELKGGKVSYKESKPAKAGTSGEACRGEPAMNEDQVPAAVSWGAF